MELARVIPASAFSAGSGLPGRELTPGEARTFARKRRAAALGLVLLAMVIPFVVAVIVVEANEPRVDRRVKRYNSGGIELVADFVGPIKHGPFTEYFTSGQKRAEGTYWDNEKHGLVTTWFWNGVLESRSELKRGIRHGRFERFWPSGAHRSVEEYQDGAASGHWQTWQVSGALETEAVFSEVRGHFVERSFYDNGQLRQETPYVDGWADGLVTAYWENGVRMTEGRMAGGERNGMWWSWDESGRLQEQVRYLDGEPVEPEGSETARVE